MINVSYEFIIELDTIIKIKSVDDVLDYIFCYISRFLCLKDATNIVNDILKNIDIEKYDDTILIGILTSMIHHKNILYYETFYEKIMIRLTSKYGEEETTQILWGLKN